MSMSSQPVEIVVAARYGPSGSTTIRSASTLLDDGGTGSHVLLDVPADRDCPTTTDASIVALLQRSEILMRPTRAIHSKLVGCKTPLNGDVLGQLAHEFPDLHDARLDVPRATHLPVSTSTRGVPGNLGSR